MRRRLIQVDFQRLENSSYKHLNKLGKEIIDRMVEISNNTGTEKAPLSDTQKALWDLVTEAIKSLTPRQTEVLFLAYGIGETGPMSEREIADRLGISRTTVQDVKSRAIKKIQSITNLNENVVKNIKYSKKVKKLPKK
jgi:RNA polymerase sigma factor (sigma-70 family)